MKETSLGICTLGGSVTCYITIDNWSLVSPPKKNDCTKQLCNACYVFPTFHTLMGCRELNLPSNIPCADPEGGTRGPDPPPPLEFEKFT